MNPRYLVIDAGSSLKDFKSSLEQPELPCIDVFAVLEKVVDTVSSRAEADQELQDLGRVLLADEFLGSRTASLYTYTGDCDFYETVEENIIGLDFIVGMARKLGQNLKQQFEAYQLYQNGEIAYEFHGIVDEHAIALRLKNNTGR